MPLLPRLCLLMLLLAFGAQANTPIQKLLKEQLQNQAQAAAKAADPQSDQLAALYSEAAQLTEQRDEHLKAAAQYQAVIDGFAQQQAKKEAALAQYQSPPLPKYDSWPESRLDKELPQVSSNLARLNDQLDNLINEQSRISSRAGQGAVQAAALRSDLSQQQAELDKLSGSGALDQAKLALAQAKVQMLQAWIKRLELEDASASQRLRLKELDQELLTLQIADQVARQSAMQAATNAKRQARIQATLLESLDKDYQHPFLDQLAQESIGYADQLAQLNDQIVATLGQLRDVKQKNLDWREYQASVQKQIEWLKVSAAFGETLRIRYDQLPRDFQHRRLVDTINQARIDKYEFDQKLKAAEPAEALAGLSDRQRQQARKLLETRRQLLKRLSERTFEYLGHLTQLEIATGDLEKTVTELKTLIEGHLFWIPNARPLSWDWIKALVADSARFAGQKLGAGSEFKPSRHPLLLALVLGLVLLAVLIRWLERYRLRTRLAELGRPVGNVTRDSITFTLKALALTVAYATPVPLLFLVLGLLAQASQPALAMALYAGACGTGIWLTVRNLTHEEGVLQGHFRWRAAGVKRLRITVRRLALVATPLLMLTLYCQLQAEEAIRQGLGRLAFMALAAGLALFYQQLYKHRALLVYNLDKGLKPKPWHHLLWWLSVVIPLASLGLAVTGYYYTAQQLLWLEQLSLLMLCGYGFIYYLAKRLLLIERRKIAFAQAKAKRAELLAQRAKENPDGDANLEVPPEEALIDIETIASQSIVLMRTLFKLVAVISLLLLWSSMYDALSYFEHVNLWDVTTLVDGEEKSVPVTLMALIWALLALMLTVVGSRNLPGFLELALLQRLQLSPGTGFAVTTVSRYLVIVVGLVAVFGLLGIEWAKAQWLVAALTVGLGFGLQEIFANFVSGLIILFEKPIRIGDTVTIRDLSGTVARINTRATTIVDWDHKEIIVPNKAFITEQLVNWSLSDPVTRLILKVSVNHGSDTDLVQRLMLAAAKDCPLVLENPEPSAYLLGIGPSSLDFELRVYVGDTDNRLRTCHALYSEFHRRFAEQGIQLAWPKLDLKLQGKAEAPLFS
ncbi:mechanosensitive ion channel [Gallaecimonas kandeliae]|uniref:mechanosensitive ion channel domain-containing protein n=1 Tax=Gallaecimonas kandeliae TaxID=3029055 RepID=UPI002649DF6A|nr:mechanosensitive ion channel domain-containing protein [Gallaecimonas kandeliae]WKE65012.1 mechanosensitive ion channel [Gallaecimonas kandeliae]